MEDHRARDTGPGTEPSPELAAAAGALVRERLRFGLPVTLASLGGYLAIAVLTGFTGVLDARVGGPASLTLWLLMALVPYVWALTLLYRRRADGWDARAAAIRAASEVRP